MAAAQTALATTLNDSTGTGSGSVDWTFGIPDNQVDFLADGQTLTLTYNVNVSDGSDSAMQTVTVTVTGANDAVVITSGPIASCAARPSKNPNKTPGRPVGGVLSNITLTGPSASVAVPLSPSARQNGSS